MSEVIKSSICGEIYIEHGNLPMLRELLNEKFGNGSCCFIVTDKNIAEYWLQKVKTALGRECAEFIIEAGEKSKCPEVLFDILRKMAESGLTRSDFVLALGGGVAGDIAGLAASLYMRGVPLVQVPTSLLAMVDSSIGGKNGIDTAFGKNIIGTFLMPELTFIDTCFLETLPDEEFTCGMAEVIKYGAIGDKELFDTLENEDINNIIDKIISRCVRMKVKFAEIDLYDKNERRLLNFGHSFGHAIEKLSNYKIPHGRAVAKGMVIAAKLSADNGYCNNSTVKKLENLCKKYSLVTENEYSIDEMMKVILSSDKKRTDKGMTFVLLRDIGESFCKNDNFNYSSAN